jgi:superfamily II DNA or RNA helicase
MSLSKDISDKLLKYQVPHTESGIRILKKYGRLLDGSDTGTGKTYTAIAICLALKLHPFIISPKSVISSWKQALKHFGIKYVGIANYESLQNCQYYKPNESEKTKFPYMKKVFGDDSENDNENNNSEDSDDNIKLKKKSKGNASDDEINLVKTKSEDQSYDSDQFVLYEDFKDRKLNKKSKDTIDVKFDKKNYEIVWNMPKNTVVIFDEAHRCKNLKTINSRILQALVTTETNIILLSATICDKKEKFAICGYVLKLYEHIFNAKHWINKNGENKDNPMISIHKILYPERASRMKIKELGDAFPKNQILCECFEMDSANEIEKMYDLIKDAEESLKTKEDNADALAKLTYARMRIEQLKIPIFISETKKYIKEGNSVAIFVNYTDTLQTLCSELRTKCSIHGEQTKEVRDNCIARFQKDKERIIICNIKSGGVGISLHDTIGKYPRVALISPTWSGQDLLQVFGRCHRANGKTPVRQRLIFCAESIEEKVCENVKEKILTVANLNDGNTDSYKIEGKIFSDIEQKDIIDKDKAEMDELINKISTLNAKKDRLTKDLEETNNKIKLYNSDLDKLLLKG